MKTYTSVVVKTVQNCSHRKRRTVHIQILICGLIVQNRVQQRAMDCNPAVVIDEAQLAEPVHEKMAAGSETARATISSIGVEFQQERIQAEHGRHDQCTAIAVLDIGGVHDGMDQQALRVDENMPLLALDLLSRVVTRRINRGPPFSALFTLWLSITAAVGLASFATASRHFT